MLDPWKRSLDLVHFVRAVRFLLKVAGHNQRHMTIVINLARY